MENPDKKLSLGDLQVGIDIEDLSQIFSSLDHCDIVNYYMLTSLILEFTYLSEDSNCEVEAL